MTALGDIERVVRAQPGYQDHPAEYVRSGRSALRGVPWRRALERRIAQDPLIETRPSLAALAALNRRPAPGAVFLGVGLCNRTAVGAALPVDVLGMLLPAEHIRAALGARAVIALIADEHALCNGLEPDEVARRARDTAARLAQVRRVLGLSRLIAIRASSFHRSAAYRQVLAEVERRAPTREHRYVTRQVADGEFFHRLAGGVIKVGWSADGRARSPRGRYDERAFDRRATAWLGHHVGFVYCKAGRALNDRRPKAPPYLAVEAEARVCLRPGEDVAAKLRGAARRARPETIRGVRKHLRRLMYSACARLGPIRGSLEHRVQVVVDRIVSASPTVAAADTLAEFVRRA